MIQFPFIQNFSALTILKATGMLSALELIQVIDPTGNRDEKFPIMQQFPPTRSLKLIHVLWSGILIFF